MTFIKVKEHERDTRSGYDQLRGYGSIIDQASNLVSSAGSSMLQAGSGAARQAGSSAIERALRSSQFSEVLDAVEDRAKQAVSEEAGKNAVNLMAFAVAGGAIGGALFRGTTGMIIASAIAGYAGIKLMENTEK